MQIKIVRENHPHETETKKEPDRHLIVQIYEIQDPHEAELVIGLGVDHMGSVVVSQERWKGPDIRDAVRLRLHTPVKSALIPLYNDPDLVYRTADYYQPDIIHFCEALVEKGKIAENIGALIRLQEGFKKRFPEIKIMRAVPIAPPEFAERVPTLELAAMFESTSDYFLTDTLLVADGKSAEEQPEAGFVGITGEICDWKTARKLVENSQIPVILAGGISPENVVDGIAAVRPAGVDSCTRTNALDPYGRPIRFKKDPEKVKQLIAETRRVETDPDVTAPKDDGQPPEN